MPVRFGFVWIAVRRGVVGGILVVQVKGLGRYGGELLGGN